MVFYYFINHTKKQIIPFNNANPVLIELEKACSKINGWSIQHVIMVDVDKIKIDFLVIQKDYEFLILKLLTYLSSQLKVKLLKVLNSLMSF